MKNCKFNLLLGLTLLVATALHYPASGQIDVQLQFRASNDTGDLLDAPFTWQPLVFFVDGVTVVSPGGTVISDEQFFPIAEFYSFEDFQNDVVGTWSIFFINETVKLDFDIPKFDFEFFPPIEIASPNNGDQFFSREVVELLVEPTIDPSILSGTSVRSFGGVVVDSLGSNGLESSLRFTLAPNVEMATVEVARLARLERADLVTNLRGDIKFFELMPSSIVATSPRVSLDIVFQPGDVNLDGTVDLLDIAPFVELLTNTSFLNEADINRDGVVDLLDVTPFVDLLTGG